MSEIHEQMPEGVEMQEPEKKDIRRELFDWAQALVPAWIVVVLLFTFAGQMITVEGPSMQETLQDRDYILVSNMFYTPRRGDIVVFTQPGRVNNDGQIVPMVKRVIAMGGDTIDIRETDNGMAVYLQQRDSNEFVRLDEPYLETGLSWHHHHNGTIPRGGLTIPDGKLFVMGDNRPRSADSREPGIGLVDERWVLGRMLLRIWPFSLSVD
ncbi:MAG: signal peptidase I [Oscillospiraceae bacterium]|nr:signal peptidase I [Oscillospiraceae bacterium]